MLPRILMGRTRVPAGVVVLALSLSACSAGPSDHDPARSAPVLALPTGAAGAPVVAVPSAGPLGAGFVTPSAPPPPGGTMTPTPGSWDRATPPPGYRVVLLTTRQDAGARVVSVAVEAWAAETGVDLVTVAADDPASYVASAQEAIDLHRDLIITVGDGLVDPLALVTASWLDQEFLVVGAELAEPTYNVTAADWVGASFRGEGLGAASTYDPASFTRERSARAVRAGVAAVVSGYTGYVVQVD